MSKKEFYLNQFFKYNFQITPIMLNNNYLNKMIDITCFRQFILNATGPLLAS